MITRLKVSGFKNLLDLDVRLGPFNCVIGENGVGKSNLFDAIRFLGLMAELPLMDAAAAVRDAGRRGRDIRGLFYRSGGYLADRMDFEIEVIVPPGAMDDFGQSATASTTLLRYAVTIGLRKDSHADPLMLLREELKPIPRAQIKEMLQFPCKKEWLDSVGLGARRGGPFISTGEGGVKIHQDGGSRGKPLQYDAASLKRTVLAASNAAESPTILVLRKEMASWMQLQMEPSALRQPDEFTDPARIDASGRHIPAALDRLQSVGPAGSTMTRLANRLSELIGGVRAVSAERDPVRETIRALVTFKDGTAHPASSLSDGTLRFLALAILEQDPEFRGVLCLEEPENGIHPEHVQAMVRLLTDIAVGADYAVDADNPMRQVIINTHSPVLAAEAPPEAVLRAESVFMVREGQRLSSLQLTPLPAEWRDRGGRSVSRADLVEYVSPVKRTSSNGPRVADRPEIQRNLFGADP